jgi:cyclase
VHHFGSQSIVLYVEAKKVGEKKWEAYTDGGRERSGVDVIEWVKKAISLGVGEILVTSIDRDGTRKGYELELIEEISKIAPIPVIAHGGAGEMQSFKEALKSARADAVAASSVFHYKDYSIKDAKKYLNKNNLKVRI